MNLSLADKMSASVAERQARVEELAAIIEAAQAEEDAELRASFRADPASRHDATSKVSQIRRRRAKAEAERESLLHDLIALQDEARVAARDEARAKAEKALADYAEFSRTEAAFRKELKSDLLGLLDKFCASLPRVWEERRQFEDRAARLCAEAGMDQKWSHALDQARAYRTPENFMGQIEAAIRSIRIGEVRGESRTAVERDPAILFRFARVEDSPTYVEPKSPEYVWIDMSSAPLVSVDGPGRKDFVRQWQGPGGSIHPSMTVRRAEPSDAEKNEKDPRTGGDLWRRVDAALLKGAA